MVKSQSDIIFDIVLMKILYQYCKMYANFRDRDGEELYE